MLHVKFFTTLRLLLKLKELEYEIGDHPRLRDVLNGIEEVVFEKSAIRFLDKLIDPEGELIRGTIILLNGRNVLHEQGLDTLIQDDDTLVLFPPGGGG